MFTSQLASQPSGGNAAHAGQSRAVRAVRHLNVSDLKDGEAGASRKGLQRTDSARRAVDPETMGELRGLVRARRRPLQAAHDGRRSAPTRREMSKIVENRSGRSRNRT